MNRPIVLAQLGGSTAVQSVRVIKLAKPGDGQAQTVYLGYEQKFRIDLSGIASEKITFVHVGERLVILFDNKSTLTIDPFFDSSGGPRNNIAFDVNGREIDGSQFASTFPITTDQSVLPAAGDGAGGAPASGGNFRDASVDPFGTPDPLALLGQEELGNLQFTDVDAPGQDGILPTVSGDDRALLVDDQNLSNGSTPDTPVTDSVVLAFTAGTDALTEFFFRNDTTGLSSELTWVVSPDGQQITGSDERGAVVRITLVAPDTVGPGATGNVTITVELLQNFDTHPGINVDDLFDLGSLTVVASTAGGIEVSATVTVAVSDDVPTLAGGEAAVSAFVEEDGMSSIGGDLSDGNKDGTDDDTQDEASGVAGSLGVLFNSGADAPLTFSLLSNVDGLPTLFSKGEQVAYEVVGNTLTATAGGREVFTLTVNADGSWAFDLKDQLDHVDNGLNDENLELRTSADGSTGVGAIDFSSIIVATDSDGDSVSGLTAGRFTITVEDDIPEQLQGYEEGEGSEGPYQPSIIGFVEEDGMSQTATAPFPADLSEGNKEPFDTNGDDEAGAGYPSLQTLFSSGADEPLTFSLADDPTELLPTLFSKGVQLEYTTENGVLTATAGDRTVFVLAVLPDGTWTFDLQDQLDHVDDGFNDENTLLRTSAENPALGVETIDFSSIIVATDFDGDSVEGVSPGTFAIIVQDDVPVVPSESAAPVQIDEDDLDNQLSTGNNDLQAGDDVAVDQLPEATGILPFSIGADEPADVTFASMDGDNVVGTFSDGIARHVESQDRPLYYFWDQSTHTLYATWIEPADFDTGDPAGNAAFKIQITDTDTGAYTFTLLDQLDHLPNFAGEPQSEGEQLSPLHYNPEQPPASPVIAFEDNIRLDLTYTVTDADGDEATGTVSFDVDDDVPVLADVAPAARYVDEDDIATWNPHSFNNPGSKGNEPNDGPGDGVDDGSETGNPPSNNYGPAFIQGSIANQVKAGADEQLKFSFVDRATVRADLEALGLSSQGAELSYDVVVGANSSVLYGYDNDFGSSGYGIGDRLVFKLTLNTDGTYTFELFDQLDHDSPFDDAGDAAGPGDTFPTSDQNTDLQDDAPNADVNSIDFGQVIKATDFDGDSITLDGRLTITIRDDVPETRDGEVVRGVVEEEHLHLGNEDFDADPDLDQDHNQIGPDYNDTTTVVSGSGGNSLASLVNVGADEAGKFNFKSNLINTNVKDLGGNNVTSDGVQVKITSITSGHDFGGDYQLLTAKAGNKTVFTLKVYEDGDWRFELQDQIDHHPINDADNVEDFLALNFSGLIKFTDFDGDTIGLDAGSFYVKVIDDVPVARIELTGRSVIHDETPGDDGDHDTLSNSVKNIFQFVTNRGNDVDVTPNDPTDAIGFAQNSQPIVDSDSSVGADQPGSQVFSLSVVQGVDSGLRTTEGGVIRLYAETNNGVDYIVGRVGDQNGPAAFAIHINGSTGVVSVAQYLSLQHDDINDHDESNDNGFNSGDDQDLNQFPNPEQQDLAGKIRAVITVTDQDGDQDTASVDIGAKIQFQDDGPRVKVEANDHKDADDIKVTLDETNPGGTPDDNNGFTDVVAPTTVVANLKPIGQVSTPSNATSSVAVSDLFDVSINEGADGVAPADVVTTYSLKLVDKNGNSDVGKYVQTTLKVTNLDGSPYEGASATLRTVWLVKQPDGTILGVIGRNADGSNNALGDYIALKIELTGTATDPQFTVTQYLPIDHPTPGSSHDEGSWLNLVGSNSSLQIVLNVKATDGDGDYDSDSHAIEVIDHDDSIVKIEDDGPSIVAGQSVTTAVYEDGLATGNADGVPLRPGEEAPSGAASFTAAAGTLNALVDFGTDGPHPTQAFSIKQIAPSNVLGLTSNNAMIWVVSEGTNTLRGYVEGGGGSGYQNGSDRLVFTLTVNGDGSYTFTLHDQIDHPTLNGVDPGDNTENSLAVPLDLSSYILAKDGDGDTVALGAGAFVVTIQDDVPIQLAGTVSGRVEEEHGLPGGNEDVDDVAGLDLDTAGNLNATTNEATGVLSTLVKIGADEPGTFGIAANPTGLPTLTSLDQPIVYHVSGNKLTAYVDSNSSGGLNGGDRQIFTLEITNTTTGAYKFALLDNVDHHSDEAADGLEGILALNLSSAITFTDRDGDTIVLSGGANGDQGLIVTVIDDVPVVDGKICLTSGTGVAQYGANPADMLYAIPPGTGLTIDVTNFEDGASHANSLGYVFLNAAGQPISGVIIEDEVNDNDADRTITIPAGSVPAGAVMLGFFIIPDGNDLNNIADGDAVTFQNVFGHWVAFHDGNPLFTAEGHVLFSDRRLNPDINPDGNLTPGDDFDHNTSSGTTSNAHWEDTVGGIFFNGSDKDFDDVEFTVTVCATSPNIVVVVDEDGLPGHGIDDNRPGEYTGTGLASVTSAAAALAALVDFGADGPHATNPFSLAPTLAPQPIPYQSKGGDILVITVGNQLIGYVEEGAVDREVFTLTVEPDGTYAFTLKDQIDHPALDGQNPGDNSENLLANAIDLSAFIVAMDGDGDKLTLPAGTFQVQVLDDIPVANAAAYVTGDVDEDDLKQITPENDNSTGIPAEGSGLPDAPTDKFTFTAASLATLIASVGTDEPGSLIFNGNVSGAVQKVGGGAVESHGDPVLFDANGGNVVGFVDGNNNGQYEVGERLVFTMTLQPNGDIVFDLKDQIDHPFASGESAKVEINLSPALLIKDFDDDTVPVAVDKFTIKIENDIPGNTAEKIQFAVGEDELSEAPGASPTPDLSTGVGSSAAGSDETIITNAKLKTLVVSGADEEVQFELNTAIGGKVFTLNGENVESLGEDLRFDFDAATQTLVGFVDNDNNGTYEANNDRAVFRMTALPGGDFRFDLLDQLDHDILGTSGAGDFKTLTIDLSKTIVARDYDGDVVNLGLESISVVVENDIPALVVNANPNAIVVDETALGVSASAGFGNFFTALPGADEPATVSNYALAVSSQGVVTNLVATVSNEQVKLVLNGSGVVEGRTVTSDQLVFTVSVNGSGTVTLTQLLAVAHGVDGPEGPAHDDPASLNVASLITLSATITDSDGDTVPGTANIAAALQFNDDGPCISLADAQPIALVTDDTDVVTSASASFAGLFTGNFGADSFKDTDNDNVQDADAIRYALSLNGGLGPVASGVFDTLSGEQVMLNVVGGEILGTISGNVLVFKITVDASGTVELTQERAVVHDDPLDHEEGDANEPTVLALPPGSQISLTATIEDGDGDTDSVSADITGSFAFEDDGPQIISVTPDGVVLGTELVANGSFEDGHGVADGAFSTFYSITGWNAADRNLPGTADDIPFEIQQGNIGGLAAHTGSSKVELDGDTQPPNQTGLTNATIEQAIATAAGEQYQLSFWYSSRPGTTGTSGMDVFFDGQLVLSIPPNNAFSTWTQFTLTVTAIDSSSVLSFTATGNGEELGAYLDDVSVRQIISSNVTDDEDTQLLGVGIQGGPGDDGAGVVSTGKINFDAGEDGLKSIVLNGPPNVTAIWVDANGVGHQEPVTYNWVPSGAGGTLYGFSTNFPNAANPVFSLTVDQNGNYTFTQRAPLAHPLQDNLATNPTPVEIEFEDNLSLGFGFTITDGDDDTATGTITVNVDDDTPIASNETVVSNEGQTVTGVLDFVGGADGASVTHINGIALTFGNDGWSQYVTGPQGSLRVMVNGNYQFVAQSEDPYVDGGTAQFTFTVTDGDGDASHALVNVTVNDTIQTNFVMLDDVVVLENQTFVYTAHLDYAPLAPLTVTLSNGVLINFAAGQLNSSSVPQAAQGDDVYADGEVIPVSISSISANNFEAVNIADTATVTINDTTDTVTATLTAGASTFDASGVTIPYTVTLSGGPGAVAPTDGPLTFTLANGTQVVIAQGATSQTVNVFYAYATFTNPVTNSISSVSGDNEYENLVTAGSTSVNANTLPEATDSTSSLTVAEAALDTVESGDDLAPGVTTGTNPGSAAETATDTNGLQFTATGENIVSITFADPNNTGDAFTDPTLANLDAGQGSPTWTLSDGDRVLTLSYGGQTALVLQLSGASTVTAGNTGNVTVTATLVDHVLHQLPPSALDVILSGVTVVATDTSGDTVTGSITVTVTDDLPIAAPDAGSVNEGVLLTVNAANGVLANDVAGADGYDGGPSITTPVPLGGEIRVNSETVSDQRYTSVAALEGGGFVVTWGSYGQDGTNFGVYGQRYDASGAPSGSEFRVNTHATGDENHPAVAALEGGGFVVTWTSLGQDGSGWGIYGQRYDASGGTAGGEFRVNTYTSLDQAFSSVTALEDGGFVVTWSSSGQDGNGYGIYGQRYDASGGTVGVEFHVSTFTSGEQSLASVVGLNDGGFVVVWNSNQEGIGGYGIYGQRYNAAGAPVGSEFHVNTYTPNLQLRPSVAVLESGGFVVTWASLSQDGSDWGVYGQRYDASGVPSGSEFRVNTYTASDQVWPSVTALQDGGFVVSWSSGFQDGSSWGVYGQRYDAAGDQVGSEFRINETTAGEQINEASGHGIGTTLDQLANGELIAVWYGQPSVSGYEVYARRFDLGTSQAVVGVRAENGDATTPVLTGVDAAIDGDFGTLTLHGDGSYSYQSNPNAVPPAGAQDVFVYTIRDGDGDLSTTTLTINVTDVPTNSTPEVTDGVSELTVSEAALDAVKSGDDLSPGVKIGTNPGSAAETAIDTNGLQFTATGENIVSITFADPNNTGDAFTDPTLANLGAGQGSPTWTLSDGDRVLTLSYGGQAALILQLSGASAVTAGNTGNVTVTATLVDHVFHQLPPSVLDVILSGVTVVATDASGDTVTGSITVTVVDDAPVAFTPDAMTVGNAVQSSPVVEDVQFAEAAGADGVGSVRFTFTEGAALTDTLGAATYFNNSPVTLHYGADNTILEARNALGEVAFTIDLDGGMDTYSLDLNGTLYNVVPLSFANVSGTVGGGNNTFKALGVGTGGPNDIIISGSDSVNTNATEIGIGTGNDFGNGDVGRFDLRESITVDAGNSNGTGFLYGDYYTTTSFKQTLSKVNSGAGGATFTVKAIIADGDTNFFGDPGDALTGNITVKLYSSTNVLLNTFTNNAGGSVIVTGALQDNYFIVESTTPFNAVQIEGGAGEAFKLGAISVGVASDLDPFAVSLPIVGTDGDGDPQASNLTVNFAPPAPPVTDLNGFGGGDDTTASFVEDGGAISIGTADATITDADSTHLTSMSVTLTNRPDGDLESLSLNAEATAAAVGLTVAYTASTGVLLISGSATVATYETILRGVQYNNTDQDPTTGTRTIDVVVNDGVGSSLVNTSTVTVNAANDAPTGIHFAGNNGLTAGISIGGSTLIASNSTYFTLSTEDVDSSSFTYTFNGLASVGANVGGSPETFNMGASSGIVSTPDFFSGGTFSYSSVQTITFNSNQPRSSDGTSSVTETVTLRLGLQGAGGDVINGSATTHDQVIYGFGGNDALTGGSGNDWISGGTGADTMTGNGGADTFSIVAGQSTPSIGGSGNSGTISGFDVITDFNPSADKIDFSVAPATVADAVVNGSNSDLTIGGERVRSHSVTDGIVTFDDSNTFASALSLTTSSHLAAVVDYLTRNDIGSAGATVAFEAMGHLYVYQQGGSTNSNGTNTLVQLSGLDSTDIVDFNALIGNHVDPIVIDLGAQGIHFTSLDNGVSFDINADGAVDQVAWTTGEDGIVALDVNGNGTIDSGAEIFSPYFAGGDHASSLAALASLDSNGDGVMDANDAEFANLTVWQDVNHDGVSQANELSSLADHGITSIDLQATPADSTIDGQQVLSQGTFTTADGGPGTFVEVAFDTAVGANDNAASGAHTTVLTDAHAAEFISDYSAARGDVIDITGLLESNFGPDSNLSDFVNVIENGSDVTIQIDQNGPASGAHFVDVAVLQGYGTSASDIVRIAFENAEQQIAV